MRPTGGEAEVQVEARIEVQLGVEHVRVVRVGTGANCSSVGSVVDTLFLSAAAGGAVVAAILAAMRTEPRRVAGDVTDAPGASEAAEAAGAGAPAQGEEDG